MDNGKLNACCISYTTVLTMKITFSSPQNNHFWVPHETGKWSATAHGEN